MENLFILASREQLRFKVSNGTIAVEDLWVLKLEDLDKLYKSLNKQLKESEEESLLKTRTTANKTLELQVEIVKYVVKTRLEEDEAKKLRKDKLAQKAKIVEIIGRKQEAALENKTVEELTAMVEDL